MFGSHEVRWTLPNANWLRGTILSNKKVDEAKFQAGKFNLVLLNENNI